ncbi:hypothetical protein CYV19_08445 [Natronobacterium gregoryi SP2]|uniref:Uncharacterized protein n=1 Tax=Natronobacterium gregoryi (strain ATCC 43098 / DSM 3393 / CCM 3738 / CIP 104747 / IAM 13177 / JCM 8860 / NBRC 102187 / NCIMB 2189 / SP2) TaxID=797304 RepID=L9Y5Z9_NATGS|nr:hypothetical protein C490_08621 [Natronobacterium gregoryi SP2]PLK20624.1 hypothetical protein CYV19_08445 [Natronobacterium gregoryi SP2]
MLYRFPGATAGGLAVAPELTDSKPYQTYRVTRLEGAPTDKPRGRPRRLHRLVMTRERRSREPLDPEAVDARPLRDGGESIVGIAS